MCYNRSVETKRVKSTGTAEIMRITEQVYGQLGIVLHRGSRGERVHKSLRRARAQAQAQAHPQLPKTGRGGSYTWDMRRKTNDRLVTMWCRMLVAGDSQKTISAKQGVAKGVIIARMQGYRQRHGLPNTYAIIAKLVREGKI